MLCTAIIGGAVGAIVGAVGYTAYTIATGKEFNTGNMLLAAGEGIVAGSLIGTGVGIAVGMSAAATTTTALATNGDPADELNTAISIGQTAIEIVTSSAKIASQLQSKAGILGITPSGAMVSIFERVGPSLQKLQDFVDEGYDKVMFGVNSSR